ncbi:hypothetical protein PISMIDRAFT_690432 [Pisolithus microcarpus 441]|uniref:Uncharacterized protein n=1 Tax=Pisolithus microcarpus 441 TaxID=765257 RepID=A0A0C9YTZ5_9AGAM|nr:hypothetical protein PISMIDRAFT_690432 [Pisolithus microcarpus 441]
MIITSIRYTLSWLRYRYAVSSFLEISPVTPTSLPFWLACRQLDLIFTVQPTVLFNILTGHASPKFWGYSSPGWNYPVRGWSTTHFTYLTADTETTPVAFRCRHG